MKLEGTYAFEAPLETVWQGLFDPEVLARTLPGCDKLERSGDQFLGEINVKMGPVQGKFQGKVDIQNVKDRESYTMVVDGRGPAGFAKATANIRVKSEGAATRLDYDSDVQVGGKIASVGQRLIDASSRAIVKQSLEGLHEQLKALAARSVPPTAAAAPQEPAQAVAPQVAAPQAAASPPPAQQTPAAVATATAAVAAPAAVAPAAVAASGALPPPISPVVARAAAPLPAPRAPSQASFALGVAKEVTKEMLPRKVVWPLIALLVAAWLLYRFS